MSAIINFQKLGLGNLTPSTSLVFCCDMQERFRPAIKYFEEIVAVAGRVLKAAELLDVPVIVTEQVGLFQLRLFELGFEFLSTSWTGGTARRLQSYVTGSIHC